MEKIRLHKISTLILVILMINGCSAIEKIFEAGFWAGLIAAIILFLVIFFIIKIIKAISK